MGTKADSLNNCAGVTLALFIIALRLTRALFLQEVVFTLLFCYSHFNKSLKLLWANAHPTAWPLAAIFRVLC